MQELWAGPYSQAHPESLSFPCLKIICHDTIVMLLLPTSYITKETYVSHSQMPQTLTHKLLSLKKYITVIMTVNIVNDVVNVGAFDNVL